MDKIRVELLPGGQMPCRMSDGAAGYDAFSRVDCTIYPGETVRISLGFCIELPPGYGLFGWGRSGISNQGIHRTAGVTDSDYRGEVFGTLFNTSNVAFKVEAGMRIIQFVIQKVETPELELVSGLSTTARGAANLGSTGHR